MGLAPSGPGLEQGRLKKRQRRRIMSYPLVIRLMIGMALMPDTSYCEALTRLAGRGSRRLRLRLARCWPWAAEITTAITRLQAMTPG
jgi:hypothetical protein